MKAIPDLEVKTQKDSRATQSVTLPDEVDSKPPAPTPGMSVYLRDTPFAEIVGFLYICVVFKLRAL